MSRAPVALVAGADPSLTLELPARAGATLDGVPAEGAALFDRDRLARGAFLALKKRVVLYLHLAEIGARPEAHGLSGESAAVRAVCRAITRVADLDVPVLVRGETGSGKERVAQAIHRASGRAGPCVAVNVATLSPDLAGAELFGHARGAFTGASESREGLFVEAHRGTLFLDEIGELSEEVQPMLLRVLETGTVRAVGAREEQKVDVRVVAATDADLEGAIASAGFRAALYHRLRGYEITVPPLRERREDVPALAMELLEDELRKTGELHRLDPRPADAPPWIDPALMTELVRREWPGNVRQLRGSIRQIVVSSRGERTLRADAVALREMEEHAGDRPGRSAADLTSEEILLALRGSAWSFAKAARALGIGRSALYRRAASEPALRAGGDLEADELARCLREHDGDLDRAAAHLHVSKRALKLRLRALGLV